MSQKIKETKKSEVKKVETKKEEAKKPEVKKVETKKEEAKKPEVKKVETKKAIPDNMVAGDVIMWKEEEWKVIKNIHTMKILRVHSKCLKRICLVSYTEI